MARTALRDRAPSPVQTEGDDSGAPVLSPHEILDCLEPVASGDIDRAPRGIIYGAICGAVIWSLIIGALLLLR